VLLSSDKSNFTDMTKSTISVRRPLSKSIAVLAATVASILAPGVAGAASLVWDVDGTSGFPTGGAGTWDTTGLVWDDAGVMKPWVNVNVDSAVFGGTSGAVALGTGITVGNLTFDSDGYTISGNTLTLGALTNTMAANGSATISSVLAGSAGLTKTGAGTLTLSGANTVAGQIVVSAGVLKLGNAAALGGSGTGNETVVQNGGTLDVNGQLLTNTEIIAIAGTGADGNGALINTGAAQLNALNKVVLTGDATVGGTSRFDIRAGTTPTLSLNGFTLTKAGANQFSLVGTTITNGNLIVNGGILSIETSSTATGSGTITIGSGGTLAFYGTTGANITRDIIANGGTITNLGSDASVNSNVLLVPGFVTTLSGSNNTTLNGVISGDGGLSKTGTGTFILTNVNTYTGGTSVFGGTLRVTKPSALPNYTGPGSVSVNGGTLAVNVGGAGEWTAADVDSLRTSAAFGAGSSLGLDTTSASFSYSADIDGALGITKLGGNTLTLTGTNTYAGTTSIGGGTLAIPNGGAHLPAGGNLAFIGTSTLDLGGNTQTFGAVAVNGVTTGTIANGTIRTNSITFDAAGGNSALAGSPIDLNGNPLSISSNAAGATTGRDRTISSVITGSGNLTIAANGDTSDSGGGSTSDFNLTGANTFTGNVTITAGVVSASSNFGNASNSVTLQGGGLVDNSAGTLNWSRELKFAGGADNFLRVYGGNTLAIGTGISGAGNLRKTDTGILSLTGTNTYAGTTIIGGGTLTIGATGSLAGTTGIRVQTGTFTNQGNVTITGTGVNDDAGGGYSLSVLNGQTFNQQGGTLSVVNFGANGTTNISGGTMNVSGLFYLSEQTNAALRTVNQTGGTLNLTTQTGNAIRLGHWNGGATTYNLSGGTLDASTSLSVLNVGWDGAASIVVGGGAGTATLKARGIQLDANGDSTTYSDTLTVSNNGVVEVGVSGIAGASANDKLILDGGTVRGMNNATWTTQITANNATTSNFDVAPTVTVTQSGVLNNAGAGAINKTGNGTLVLSNAANTFAGTLNVNAGLTTLSGAFTGTPTVNVNSGGVLAVTNAAAFTGAASVNVSGALAGTGSLGATSTTTVNAGGFIAPGANAAPGVIGTLTVGNLTATAGELRFDLNAVNAVTGGGINDLIAATGTTVNLGGVAILPRFGTAPTSGNTYTIITSTNATSGAPVLSSLVSGANSSLAFTLGQSGNNTTLSVSGSARNLTWNGDGAGNTWDLNTASNWQQAAANDSAFRSFDNVTFDDSSANKTVNVAGTILPLAVTVNNSTGNDYTFSGTGTITSGALTKQGTGKLTVTNDNAFIGTTTVSNGTLQIGAGGTTGSIGNANITNNGVVAFNRSDAVAYTGVISGTGSLVKDGAGLLSLSTLNTYTGGTTVNAGTLSLGASGGTGTIRGNLTINAGATVVTANTDSLGYNAGQQVTTVNLNGGTMNNITAGNQGFRTNFNLTAGTLSSTGGGAYNFTAGFGVNSNASSTASVISAPIIIRDSSNFTLTTAKGTTADGIDLIVSGNIGQSTGTGNLVKTGAGTMLYSGTGSYLGTTTVNDGLLLVNGSISGSAMTVSGVNAILGGSGTVGATTLTAGIITPGSLVAGNGAIGTLNTGNLALNGGTALFQLGASTSDTLNTTGTVTFGAPVELSLNFNLDLANGRTFTLINNDLVDAFSITAGGGFAIGGVAIAPNTDFAYTSGSFTETFQISYEGGSGNDAVLTVVPEPVASVSLLGGLGVLLAVGRRRRQLA
jgi:autotransporter-associated beta strand protein